MLRAFLLAVAAALLISAGFALPADGTSYRAEFTDATGLEEGDDVRIAGVRVGEVEAVRVVRDRVAEVRFRVADEIPLATSTRARIRYRNVLGERYLALAEGPGGVVRLRAGALIPLAQTRPALDLAVLFNGFRPLFQALDPGDVNALALQIVQVLQGEAGTVGTLLARTASLTNALADRDAVIARVVTNLNTVLGTLQSRDEELSGLIVALQRLVSGLAADRDAIADSLQSLGSVAGATASLVRDARPALKADIAALGSVTATLTAAESTVEQVLRRLPGQLATLTRAADDGSWLDLYLCELDAGDGRRSGLRASERSGRCDG